MLDFFDGEIGIGASGLGFPAPETPAALLAIMDHYGIADALVYDRGVFESGAFGRDDVLLDFCAASPRLHPSVCIVPPATGELPGPPCDFVGHCLERGIRAMRAWPVAHQFVFDPLSMGELLVDLERHRVPVFVSAMNVQDHPWSHQPPWRDLRDVALAFPKLPLIVNYTGMLQNRALFPLLAGCPNVHADLTCASFDYIEAVAERFGPERLIFSSHLPCEDPALYTTWVNYSGVSPEARRAIAGDNLRRLLEGIR